MTTLSDYSKHKFNQTFATWRVDREYAEPMHNYLVYGFSPGSFFTAVLANDFMSAMSRSHPANTIPALKNLVGWIRDVVPEQAWGDYKAVDAWCNLSADQRRAVLEEHNLIHTAKQETWLAVKGDSTFDPMEAL